MIVYEPFSPMVTLAASNPYQLLYSPYELQPIWRRAGKTRTCDPFAPPFTDTNPLTPQTQMLRPGESITGGIHVTYRAGWPIGRGLMECQACCDGKEAENGVYVC